MHDGRETRKSETIFYRIVANNRPVKTYLLKFEHEFKRMIKLHFLLIYLSSTANSF